MSVCIRGLKEREPRGWTKAEPGRKGGEKLGKFNTNLRSRESNGPKQVHRGTLPYHLSNIWSRIGCWHRALSLAAELWRSGGYDRDHTLQLQRSESQSTYGPSQPRLLAMRTCEQSCILRNADWQNGVCWPYVRFFLGGLFSWRSCAIIRKQAIPPGPGLMADLR